MNGTLSSHLHDIDEQANRILEQIVKAFAEADGCNEELKASDQMKWVGLMNGENSIRQAAAKSED